MSRYVCGGLKVDILFLQESWLSPDLFHKQRIHYVHPGVSAMKSAVCSNTPICCPFWGVASLINCSHKHHITNHICCERYNIISNGPMTLVNVYFPCSSKRDDIFIVSDILDEIVEKLANIVYTHLILHS